MKPGKLQLNRNTILETAINALFWTAGLIACIELIKTIGPFRQASGTLFWPMIFGTMTNIILFYTNALFLIPQYTSSKNISVYLSAMFSLLIAVTLIDSAGDILFFVPYYSTGNESDAAIILSNLMVNIFFLSFSLAYGFIRISIKNERLREKQKAEKLDAELSFLKAQLNPHFLFNVLNTAFSSATSYGDNRTAEIIAKISAMMRYVLYESNVNAVPLAKEISYIQDYIDLQKMRISEEVPVTVTFFSESDNNSFLIAPLLLITFVENAFKHGISIRESSFIDIRLTVRKGKLDFIVRNSKKKENLATVRAGSGIGLENVKRRLNLLLRDDYDLDINDSDNIYTIHLQIRQPYYEMCSN